MIQTAPWKIILTLLVCAFGVVYAAPNVIAPETRSWMNQNLPSWMPQNTVNLGLDLRGGAHLLYDVDVDVVFKDRSDAMLVDARKALRSKKIGYSRISAIPGGVRVVLRDEAQGEAARRELRQLFENLTVTSNGLTNEAVLNEVGRKQLMDQTISQSIEIVRRRIDELGTTEPAFQRSGERRILIQAPGADAESLKSIIGTTAKLNFHLVQDPAARGPSKTFPYADDPAQKIAVERRPLLTGEMLTNAQPSFSQEGQPIVSFALNSSGARRFCDVTRKNTGKPFAIVLDSEIVSAPNINEPICGGRAQISGSFTVEEVNELALLLRAGALPAPMSVLEERTVGPSLGADSVAAGKVAALIGLAGVLLFMALTYGLFGFMANVALMVNVALIFALLSSLQATLTLPGIALTIGMAVDANVLIFERIREERAAGRSILSAIDAGYGRAMTTIIDSNLTTLIAAIILFSFGTGPIKGFAVTLGIGIMTSFFTAIMVTRLMVVMWLKRNRNAEAIPI